MAVATRPKPKVHHKKRQAQHHRHSKQYLKPYWPYIPMLAIVGVGYFASRNWPESWAAANTGLGGLGPDATRVEVMVGSQDSIALLLVIIMSGMAAAIFIFRHWFRIQRILNKGERYMVKHPWFDVMLVLVCTIGVVLSRSYF